MTRRLWMSSITAIALVFLGACGDDSSSAPATSSTVASSTVTSSTVTSSTVTTIAPPANTTSPNSSTDDHAGPATIESTPLTGGAKVITLNADQVGSTPTTETVKVNTPVSITVTSATAQEFHLHDYDLEFTDRLDFTADKTGTFELESHKTGKVLMLLVVTP